MDLDLSPEETAPAYLVALSGTLLLAAAMGIGRFAYTPLLPPMQDVLGWTDTQAGDVASSNYLGYMAGALAASALAQRPESRQWLLAGMVLSALTTAAGAWIVSFPAWLAIRFLAGVGSAFCLVLGTAVIIQFLASCSRAQLGALHFAGVGVGIVASVLVIEVARPAGASVFDQWGVLGLVSVVLHAVAWLIIRTVPRQPRSPDRIPESGADVDVQPSGRLKRLIGAYALFGFGYVVTATFILTMARRLDQATLLEPLTWIVVGLLAAPSVVIWQHLARRFGLLSALRLAYAIEAAGVLLVGFASGHIAVMVGGALLGGTFMGITALGLNAGRQMAGNNQGKVIGWMTASFGVGQFLGPGIAGRIAEMTGGFAVPSLVAAALLFGGVALLWDVENL